MKRKLCIAIIAISLFAGSGGNVEIFAHSIGFTRSFDRSSTFYRTELYFGRSIPGGSSVSDEDWERFLADVVTARFPDGFTVLKATGHYREQSGKIITEPSEVIVFLYPASRRTSSRRKIEEIRRAYKTQFKQESVLRLDFRGPVKVLF